jgi:hypothetical protein
VIRQQELKPSDFRNLAELARILNDSDHDRNEVVKPFGWIFSREGLATLIKRLAEVATLAGLPRARRRGSSR